MKLYQVDNKGQVRGWLIYNIDNTIYIEHGLEDGAKQTTTETITEGKAGRTIQQQIESRINSRINKQVAKGYCYTIDSAHANKGQNELNLYKPMLAQQFNKVKNINTDGAVLQRKLDGNRMLVTNNSGELIAYSRNGKRIYTVDHILEQLDWLPEGRTIDGEIYVHGMALKDINSKLRRMQSGTTELNYHIYDVVTDVPFLDRFKLVENKSSTNIKIEPYWNIDKTNVNLLFQQVRDNGYEGLIMRLDDYGYEPGKRSKSLLKIKERYDTEYKVIDIERSKDNHGIFIFRLPSGDTFKCVAPGNHAARLDVANNPDNYIGRIVTVSYAYMTDYGKPFHPVCENYRSEDK